MPLAKTVNLDTHALATLRYIRASMSAAGNVAIPRSAGIAIGIIGLVAATLSLSPALQPYWMVVWVLTAPIAGAAGVLSLARSGSVLAFIASGTPGRKLALGMLPSLFAGAVLTAVLWNANLVTAIPGAWLLLYGSALISASVCTVSIVAWMGLCFVVLSMLAFLVPVQAQLALLGLGFGGLHIVFGILIGRGAHGRES